MELERLLYLNCWSQIFTTLPKEKSGNSEEKYLN